MNRFIAQAKLKPNGAPITIDTKWDDSGYAFEAGIPVDKAPDTAPANSPVKVKTTYAGKALKVVHKGAYRDLAATYQKLFAYVAANGLEKAGNPWDEYVNDPGKTPEPELLTNLYLPVK